MKTRINAFILCVCIVAAICVSGCGGALPQTASEFLSLGEKYLVELDYEQAVAHFQRLIEIDPMNPRGYTGLAQAYAGLKNADAAIDALQQGYSVLPDNKEFLEKSVEIYEEIIEIAPENPNGYTGLAESYVGLGQNDDAIAALQKGLEAIPGDNGLLEKAVEIYEEIIENEPDNPGAYIGLFEALTALDRPELAKLAVSQGYARIGNNPELKTLYEGLFMAESSPPSSPSLTPPSQPPLLPSPSPTPSPSPSPTPTPTPTPSPSPSPTPPPSTPPTMPPTTPPSPSPSPSPTPTPTTTPPASAKPAFTIGNSWHSITVGGASLMLDYSLSGTTPLTVTMLAIDSSARPASGFSFNTVSRYLTVGAGVPAGLYKIMLTATNAAGSASADFYVDITVVAPVFSTVSDSYSITGSGTVPLIYTLTGTAPVTISAQILDPNGKTATGVSVDGAFKTVTVGADIAAGTYLLTLTATNSAGSDKANFFIEVKPGLTAPTITGGQESYELVAGDSVLLKYTLRGTEPIWVESLEVTQGDRVVEGGFRYEGSVNSLRIFCDFVGLKDTFSVKITFKNNVGTGVYSFKLKLI